MFLSALAWSVEALENSGVILKASINQLGYLSEISKMDYDKKS